MEGKEMFVSRAQAWLYEDENLQNRADELLHGWRVTARERSGGACAVVTDYGYGGFMDERELTGAVPPSPRMAVMAAFADILDEPRPDSRLLASIPRGGLISPLALPENGYVKTLLADGRAGFIRAAYLGEPSPPPGRSEDEIRRRIVGAATSYLGVQYRWGGKTPLGVDCSGLAFMSYHLNGITIFRDSRIEPGFPVREISEKSLNTGDLLYFPGHVAIYIGDGRLIHSRSVENGVRFASLNPEHGPSYREELRGSLICCGSVF